MKYLQIAKYDVIIKLNIFNFEKFLIFKFYSENSVTFYYWIKSYFTKDWLMQYYYQISKNFSFGAVFIVNYWTILRLIFQIS